MMYIKFIMVFLKLPHFFEDLGQKNTTLFGDFRVLFNQPTLVQQTMDQRLAGESWSRNMFVAWRMLQRGCGWLGSRTLEVLFFGVFLQKTLCQI